MSDTEIRAELPLENIKIRRIRFLFSLNSREFYLTLRSRAQKSDAVCHQNCTMLPSYLDFFNSNMNAYSDKHGECFHQDLWRQKSGIKGIRCMYEGNHRQFVKLRVSQKILALSVKIFISCTIGLI